MPYMNTNTLVKTLPPSFAIPAEFKNTPFVSSHFLGQLIKGDVLFKDETITPIGSFKGRGAFHFFNRVASPRNAFCLRISWELRSRNGRRR